MNWQTKSSQKSDTVHQGVWLTNTHLARIFSCFILYSLLVFMVGYFWGKRAIAYDVMQEAESIASKDAALLQVYACQSQPTGELIQNERAVSPEITTVPISPTVSSLTDIPKLADASDTEKDVNQKEAEKAMQRYYAPLAGYSQQADAQRFADKLKRDGINVEVKKHSSKSSKGRPVTWYQVVTMHFTNREELVKLVEHVRQREHLTDDVRILSC